MIRLRAHPPCFDLEICSKASKKFHFASAESEYSESTDPLKGQHVF